MAVYKKQKTALENALDFVGGTASNAISGVKNAVSNVAQGASKSFGDFYKAFSDDYNNYKTQTDQQKTQTYQNLSNFVNGIKTAPQKTADYFNPTKGYNPETRQMDNFWTTPVAKTLTKIQKNPIVETTGKIPLNAIKAGIITAGTSGGPSAMAIGSAKNSAERKKIIEQDDALNQALYQDWYKDNPELFTKDPKTGKLDVNLLNATTAQLKGVGLLMSPIAVALGGAINVPFQYAMDKIQGKKPLEKGISKAVAEGMDFSALMGPISEMTGWALKPLLNKFNPVEVKNINQYINLAKNATTPEAKQQFVNLITKRITQNLGARALKGGVGMGVFGAMLPAETNQERINNIVSNAVQGLIFEPATGGLELGGQAATQQLIKPLLKFSMSREGQGGFIKFPGSENLTPEQYRAEIKNRLDARAAALLSEEMNKSKERTPMINEGRKMAREYLKNKDAFLDKYGVLPEETSQVNGAPASMTNEIANEALDAIRIVDNATDPADYLSPEYSNAIQKIRALAQQIAPETNGTNDINAIISAVKSKIPFEQGNIEAQRFGEPVVPEQKISTQEDRVLTEPEKSVETMGGSKVDVTPEDRALAAQQLENYRGYGIKEPETKTETYTPRDVKQQLSELQGMREDFQNQVDRIDNILENYDLMKKFSDNIMSKSGLKRLKSEISRDIKNVDKQLSTLDKTTAERTVPVDQNIPSNEELAMKVLNDMRTKTEEQTPVTSIESPSVEASTPVPEKIAPGIQDVSAAESTITPSPEWQQIPEGTPIPPGAEIKLDIENQTAYARWNPEAGAGGVAAQPSAKTLPEPIIPEGERIRGHTETVQNNEAFRQEVREKVFSTYKPLEEKVVFDKAVEYVLENEAAARARVMGNEPSSPEILALGEALFKKKQYEADLAQERGDIAGMRSLDDEAAQIDNAISERITPAARILHYAKRFASSSPQALVRWAERLHEEANMFQNLSPKRLIKKLTGEDNWKIEFNENMRSKILEEQRKINRMEDGPAKYLAIQNLMREVTKDIPPSIFQYLDAYRYQNMLIGTKTQLRNIVGNITQSLVVRPLTHASLGTQDFIFNGLTGKERQAYVKDVGTYYKGMLNSLPKAIEQFKKGFRGDPIDVDKYEIGQGGIAQFTGHNIPKGLTIAGNLLEGADRFFTAFLSDAEYNVLRSRGVSDKEAQDKALEVATKFLYRNPLDPKNRTGQGHILSTIDKATNFMIGARKGGPLNPVGWFVPFVRVPMAAAKMGVEYSPLGYSTLWGATNKSEQLAKANLGAVLMSLGAVAALNGMTTWAAPTDPAEKEAFYQTGRKPYSFGLPTPDGRTVWVPFNYFGPFGYSLAFPAAVKYRFQDAPEAFTDDVVSKLTKSLGDELGMWSQQTFLQGLGGFVRTFEGDIDYNTINQIAFTTGQLIPLNGLLGYVNSIIDPIYRKPHGFVEGVFKNVPGYSQNLEPITNAIGEPATRLPEQDKTFNAISNYVLPFAVGLSEPGYEQQYQNIQDQRQLRSEANYYDRQAQSEVDKIMRGSGAANISNIKGVNGKQKALEAQKQAVDKLLESYIAIDNPEYKDRIKKSIERQGYNFDEQLQRYMLKDVQAAQTGASEASKAILERSNEYKLIQRLVEKDGGSGMLQDYIMEQMKKRNISPEDFVYDQQTALPSDVKLTEIQTTTQGLTGEELFNKLASYRRVSEGTRKALLTDSTINDLVDAGFISKDIGANLKMIDWDAKNKKLFVNNSKAPKASKDKYKITVPKRAVYKPVQIKLSQSKPIKPLKTVSSTRAKIKAPPTATQARLRIKKITPALNAPVMRIGGLGR